LKLPVIAREDAEAPDKRFIMRLSGAFFFGETESGWNIRKTSCVIGGNNNQQNEPELSTRRI